MIIDCDIEKFGLIIKTDVQSNIEVYDSSIKFTKSQKLKDFIASTVICPNYQTDVMVSMVKMRLNKPLN